MKYLLVLVSMLFIVSCSRDVATWEIHVAINKCGSLDNVSKIQRSNYAHSKVFCLDGSRHRVVSTKID
jgi:hypothetical protein